MEHRILHQAGPLPSIAAMQGRFEEPVLLEQSIPPIATTQGLPPSNPEGLRELGQLKKRRRKEQCRVNQANYRRRKRQHENELNGQISSLKGEIQELQARRSALADASDPSLSETGSVSSEHESDPLDAIDALYRELDSTNMQSPELVTARDAPSSRSIFDLQQEEFDSVEAFRLQWLWYRQQFDMFHFCVLSSERMQIGGVLLLKVVGQVHFRMRPIWQKGGQRDKDWTRATFVCPVMHRFEVDPEYHTVSQVITEVDWISGIASATNYGPQDVAFILHELASASQAWH